MKSTTSISQKKELRRTTGDGSITEAGIDMDILTYEYEENTNLLVNVTDNAGSDDANGFLDGNKHLSSGENDYKYDQNGNMILDRNKGIESITYNHLNLPVNISFEIGRSIQYTYNAAGQKVGKLVEDNGVYKPVEYLDGFQYTGEILQFFPHAEGYVDVLARIVDGKPYTYRYKYVYNYTDHLGNIRMSYTLNPQNNKLEILEENHYFPFGLKHSTYIPADKKMLELIVKQNEEKIKIKIVQETEYQYKFGGKEYQDELNLNVYDFHARVYDPAIGRTWQMDPHAELYAKVSPYNYAFNNPVIVIDPTGKDGIVTGSGTKDDPYVIKANYYYYGLNEDQAKGFNNAVNSYNNGGKAYTIKDGDGNKVYVSFNLSATEVADASTAQEMANNDVIRNENANGDAAVLRFGNTVTNGPAGSSTDLGDANNRHINLDSTSVNGFYDSPNPQTSLQKIYAGVSIHEIGHNLGGNHGDPGNMMIGSGRLYNTGGGINNKEQTTYMLPGVSGIGIQAIMGRAIGYEALYNNNSKAGYGQTSSGYLSDKQNKNITEGSVGRLVFAPNQ